METIAETVRMNSEVANGLANHECSDVVTMATSSAVARFVQAYCNWYNKWHNVFKIPIDLDGFTVPV